MKVLVIFLVLSLIIISSTTSAFAQYYGEIKSHEFLIDHEGQHEIRLQSSTTKFNDVFYDEPADAIIISIDSGTTFTDIISIQMNYTSFRTLLADSKDGEPSDILVLLDGEEQEYHTPQIITDNVAWEFKNKPNVTEIELILEPERYRDDKTQDKDFKYPVLGGGIIAHLYSLKTQIESGLSYDELRCNERHVLIQKYDGSPACVTEQTKQKLIERGWTTNDSGMKCDNNDSFGLIRYSESDDIHPQRLVAFLKEGTSGVICLQYISKLDNEGFFDIDENLHQRDSSNEISSNVVLNVIPDKVSREYGTNVTVAYEIHSKNNSTGIYWINLSQLCDSLPVVVWNDEPRVSEDDIPVRTGVKHCPAKFLEVNIIGYSGPDLQYHSAKPT